MKYQTLIAAALVALIPTVASAQPAHLSDSRFVSAARCLAFAEAPQIAADSPDVSLLRAAYDQDQNRRPDHLRVDARAAQRSVARLAGSAAPDELRRQRDIACQGFVSSGFAVLPQPGAPDQG